MTLTQRSLAILTVVCAISVGLHLWLASALVLHITVAQIVWAYIANVLLTAALLVWLLNLKHKHQNSLGYFFLYGSFAKFGMFFAAFYPGYRVDGLVSRSEFSAFFVPYAVCLIVETSALIIKLNQADKHK